MGIQVNIKFEEKKWLDKNLKKIAKKAFEATLRLLELNDLLEKTEISILACNDSVIRSYNNRFRNVDSSTNVLSWPRINKFYDKDNIFSHNNGWREIVENDILDLGDIAISYETCLKQSQELDVILEDHILHLLVHSFLHLLGYDHEGDSDFQMMKELEIKTLKYCGIQNPYSLKT